MKALLLNLWWGFLVQFLIARTALSHMRRKLKGTRKCQE